MPKTKLAAAIAKPDYNRFDKTIKIRMIEQDTWYQEIEKKVSHAAASIRGWVKNPESFRMGDLIQLLDVLEFSPEEQMKILMDLRNQMSIVKEDI